jgi:5-methylcytosine-specific restriction enzyme A
MIENLWSRAELILALEFYMHHRDHMPSLTHPESRELFTDINMILAEETKDEAAIRSLNGIFMKMRNFRALDPKYANQGKRGLSHVGPLTEQIWDEFEAHPERLKSAAAAIRKNSNR